MYTELIDTLWNVNIMPALFAVRVSVELIDTLWNVNAEYSFKDIDLSSELIDTLWNVNFFSHSVVSDNSRN